MSGARVYTAPWAELEGLSVRPADDGLINQTFLVGEAFGVCRWVLQRVNPIFRPEVHYDIDVVTRHLLAHGLPEPLLRPTREGALWATDPEGGVWRVLEFVPGETVHRVDGLPRAAAAGALVARFHLAMSELDYHYRHVRAGAHDTLLHMARLQEVRAAPSATLVDDARALAREILHDWSAWSGALDEPELHAHGDLKLSNLRFDSSGAGYCLLDLDTLSRLPRSVEMGDAFRSWCNPVGEDAPEAVFSMPIFEAALAGYRQITPVDEATASGWLLGAERIALELAARFCRDVWEDCYFGWNKARFESRSAHNLFRARGQHSLARSIRAQRG